MRSHLDITTTEGGSISNYECLSGNLHYRIAYKTHHEWHF